MGANAHGKISEYVNQLNSGTVFLEVGSDNPPRQDGSTGTIFRIAKEHGMVMYSVDSSNNRHEIFKRTVRDIYEDNDFYLITETGERFLEDFHKWEFPHNRRISFAYLDNFDWMYNPARYWKDKEPPEQHEQYLEYQAAGIELNNMNSDIAHLKQTILVEKYSDDKCIVLFDDTFFDTMYDVYLGKGGSSISYLLSKGWEILPFTKDDLIYGNMAIMLGKGIKPNL